MKINLGDKAKDKVTGFEGIVVARTVYLNGCARIGLQSDKLKDGLPTETQWFDEPQLTLVKAQKIKTGSRDTGGPMSFIPKNKPDSVRR